MQGGIMPRCQTSSIYPLAAAFVTFLYSFLTAVLSAYIPDDQFHIGPNISTYAWAGCFLSLLGSIGVLAKQPALISLFSHFLLADAFLSALSRLFLTELFASALYSPEICGSTAYWLQAEPGHEVVTSAQWQKAHGASEGFSGGRKCELALGAVHLMVIAVLVVASAAQVSLAVVVRRFGMEVERKVAVQQQQEQQMEGETRLGDEKRALLVLEEEEHEKH